MILITGATGNIGTPLARLLIEARVPLRALVRQPASASAQLNALKAAGVDLVAGDLADPASLETAVAGVDAALLLTPVGQDQARWKSNLIRAAAAAGVKRMVNLSVAGAAPDSPLVLGRWHGESEQELEASGLGWTHLRPYDLARYNTGLFLSTALSQGAFYSTVGPGRVAMVDEEDVAAVAARALLDPAHDRKTYTLTGPEALSYTEIARTLSQQAGKPIQYVNVTEAQAKQAMLAMGLPEWLTDFINDLRRLESQDGAATVTTDVEHVTGRPATPYSVSARAALAASKS